MVCILGNHDEALRECTGVTFGDIRLETDWIHRTADGRRYWLVHGDEYDQVTRHHRWVAMLGDIAYNALVRVNTWLSRLRRLLRRPGYWSLAGYAKQRAKKAVNFIFDFEDAIAHAARSRGVDGVICGHIHWAADRDIDGLRYLNCGDWVDSCTAVVEHLDGRLEVVSWLREPAPLHAASVHEPIVEPALATSRRFLHDGGTMRPRDAAPARTTPPTPVPVTQVPSRSHQHETAAP